MEKHTRNAIERATQRARKLLEEDFAEQLEGDFDVHRDGAVAAKAGAHLSARQAFQRERIVAGIEHKRAAGMSAADSVSDYLRDAAFTTLNRFVALKMLEARELVQECITKGEQSAGYREFCGMAPGLPLLSDSAGYRLYIESLFDELSTEVKVLFDRRDPSSVLWPKRATFEQLLEILNGTELARVWGEDETIGWVYQFFNGQDERKKMREESQAPRNSRELAVRNQFFTPRYVVQFLTDNTLGRIWYEMRGTKTVLAEKCEYMVRKPGEDFAPRAKKDPRDLRVLDPACGSGHFLLYAFDLLLAIYEEAFADPESPMSEATGGTLAEDYPSLDSLRKAMPGLVLAHNLHGVDIDARCAQIAQLALWMRAQKAHRDFGIARAERSQIRRSNIVVAEPLVADEQIAKEFVAKLGDAELGRVFTSLVESLSLAGDLGLLLRVEQLVARQAKRGQTGDLTERLRRVFKEFAPFGCDSRTAKQGLTTSDDFRFVRAWFEVSIGSLDKQVFPFLKGGEYRPFYADIPVVVRWADGGAEMKAWIDVLYGAAGSWSRNIRSIDLYFSPGLTWPLRAVGLSVSPVPRGTIFSARGYLAIAPESDLLAMVGVMSSRIFEEIFRVCLSGERPEFIVGVLNALPFPSLERADALKRLARRGWSLKRSLDTINETSHAFLLPPELNERVAGLDRAGIEREVGSIQGQIDAEGYRLYQIDSYDRAAIESFSLVRGGGDDESTDGVESEQEDDDVQDDAQIAAQTDVLNTWFVGAAFGRFDPRLATGERAIPPEPEPFDPLPSRSPGMYPEGEEPADRPDILVDDEGHADDLAARAQAVAERVKVDVPEDLRGWLAKEFFPLHIKMYSKSRRKAPIYWQLATPSASYSAWLYIHAFSKDTLFRVQNDYVVPKLAHEERRLESLAGEPHEKATAAQRKELAAQEFLVEELRAFLEELKRIAPLWNPNLDDGVVINFAPLWRLVPQNRSWQKELKSTWDALCEGEYDWAHLAMHLWPERVIPKCAKDRSLAIAHGLEDAFWVEGRDGKWTARKTPTRGVDELVRERTSPAVKSALEGLLKAPGAAGRAKKTKKGRANA